MSSEEITRELAFDRLRSWNDTCATFALLLTGPPNDKRLFDLTVKIRGVGDSVGDSTLAFILSTDTADARPGRAFAHTDGTLVVSLEGALFSVAYQPERLIISRGLYRCVLTVIRPTAF